MHVYIYIGTPLNNHPWDKDAYLFIKATLQCPMYSFEYKSTPEIRTACVNVRSMDAEAWRTRNATNHAEQLAMKDNCSAITTTIRPTHTHTPQIYPIARWNASQIMTEFMESKHFTTHSTHLLRTDFVKIASKMSSCFSGVMSSILIAARPVTTATKREHLLLKKSGSELIEYYNRHSIFRWRKSLLQWETQMGDKHPRY